MSVLPCIAAQRYPLDFLTSGASVEENPRVSVGLSKSVVPKLFYANVRSIVPNIYGEICDRSATTHARGPFNRQTCYCTIKRRATIAAMNSPPRSHFSSSSLRQFYLYRAPDEFHSAISTLPDLFRTLGTTVPSTRCSSVPETVFRGTASNPHDLACSIVFVEAIHQLSPVSPNVLRPPRERNSRYFIRCSYW